MPNIRNLPRFEENYTKVLETIDEYGPIRLQALINKSGIRSANGVLTNITLDCSTVRVHGKDKLIAEDDEGYIFLIPV